MERARGSLRHGRACPGHPRTYVRAAQNVDARHKAGHDECVLWRPSQNTPSRSRRPIRASFSKTSHHPKIRGRGECRVHAAPAVSCAKLCKETHTSIQVQRRHSGIPRAMALRLMPRSPRRRIRLVTVVCGSRFVEARLGRHASADLASATDARTTRFCRTRLRRSSCAPVDRSRETRPALTCARRRCRVHRILAPRS